LSKRPGPMAPVRHKKPYLRNDYCEALSVLPLSVKQTNYEPYVEFELSDYSSLVSQQE